MTKYEILARQLQKYTNIMEKINPEYTKIENKITELKEEMFEISHVDCPFCQGEYWWKTGDDYVGVNIEECAYCLKGYINITSEVFSYSGYKLNLREGHNEYVRCEKEREVKKKLLGVKCLK